MAKQSLSSEIAENITALKKLKQLDPHNEQLSAQLQDMYDALHQVQGKEWEEQVEKYEDAKVALDTARKVTEDAIADLSKTAEAITKAADAIAKVLAAIAVIL